MEGTAIPGRLSSGPRPWEVATVTAVTSETPSVRTIGLGVPSWPGHRAGQHLDVRLTAEDGYSAERSYSIAAAADDPVAITVERLDDGEVSPYLTEDVRVGDQLEIRGPVGGYFVWETADGGPLLLVGGGNRSAAGYPAPARAQRKRRPGHVAVFGPHGF
jgi:ferredoxin-NADP reductase